ncbi:MAG: hypothetical protein FWD50_03060 [Betaproteobacteria bacterium]|nr:hypothetical protein [Betaproteobacteria bacterium]
MQHTTVSIWKSGLAIAVCVTLAACGDSSVSIVKDIYVDQAKTTTVSQLLDKRSVCENISWSSFEDEKGRTIVEYQCKFLGGSDFLSTERENFINVSTKEFEKMIEFRSKMVERFEEELASVPKYDAEISRHEKELELAEENFRKVDPKEFGQAQNEIKRLKDEIALNKANKWTALSLGKDALDRERDSLDRAIKNSEPSLIKSEAERRYPIYSYVDEKIQWVVNKEGGAVFFAGAITAYRPEGEVVTQLKYNDLSLIFNAIEKS